MTRLIQMLFFTGALAATNTAFANGAIHCSGQSNGNPAAGTCSIQRVGGAVVATADLGLTVAGLAAGDYDVSIAVNIIDQGVPLSRVVRVTVVDDITSEASVNHEIGIIAPVVTVNNVITRRTVSVCPAGGACMDLQSGTRNVFPVGTYRLTVTRCNADGTDKVFNRVLRPGDREGRTFRCRI